MAGADLSDNRVGVRSHLQMFKDGVTHIVSEADYNEFAVPAGVLGREEGLFVLPTAVVEKLLLEFANDPAGLETKLGLAPGALSDGVLLRIDIQPSEIKNLRMPSGLEEGAYPERFRFGGYTSGAAFLKL